MNKKQEDELIDSLIEEPDIVKGDDMTSSWVDNFVSTIALLILVCFIISLFMIL